MEQQVDELIETYNEIAKMLGKENVSAKTENVTNFVVTKTVELAQVCVAFVQNFIVLILRDQQGIKVTSMFSL